MFEFLQDGNFWAFMGVACAVLFSGMGSAKGVGVVGQASAGVIVEDPDKFGQLLVLQALPGTQGIYGFLIGFIVMLQTGMLGGTANVSLTLGLAVFASCLPVGLVGLVSGYHQGKVAAAGVSIVAKRPDQVAKAIVSAALVETYAILAFLISFLLIFNLPLQA